MNFDMLFKYEDGYLIWKEKRSNISEGTVAGTVANTGYVIVGIKGKKYSIHRIIWEMHNGPIPTDLQIDHIDGVRHNNKIENLRLCTQTENNQNTVKRIDNTSGYKGVRWHKKTSKWYAQISVNGCAKHIGSFNTAEAAYEAYCTTVKSLYGDFAKL